VVRSFDQDPAFEFQSYSIPFNLPTESANDVITSEIISNSLTNMDLARPERITLSSHV
jgi:hypothetical protein